MEHEIRPATTDEMGQFGLIGAYVYAGAAGDGEDNLMATSNRPEWTLCAFDGPKMVASFCTLPFTMRAMGKALPMGGITAVGTIPEYRRQGLLRKLMSQSLQTMKDEGRPVASLWATQAAIYQRYGCAMTSVLRRYEIDTVDISFFDGNTGKCQVGRETFAERSQEIRACYAQFADQRIGYLHRPSVLWQLSMLNEDEKEGPVHIAVARDADQAAVGYVIYTIRGDRVDNRVRGQEMRIRDLVWLNTDAYRSLWRFIASHDLVGRVVWANAPRDDPAPELMMEPRMLNMVDQEGYWFRIVDVKAALEGRGYTTDGELTLQILEDDLAPWNSGVWQLVVRGSECEVTPTDGPADLVMPVKALASLFTGFRSATDLAAWGLLSGEREALLRADSLFRTWHAPHCPDHF